MIKKFTLAAVAAMIGTAAMAQTNTVNLYTYSNAHIEKYDGMVRDVVMNRYMFKGWNTVCLPFSLDADQINATFGSDCRVETLASASAQGETIQLYFKDVKSQGMVANTPYIVYFNGENTNVKIKANEARLSYDAAPELSFNAGNATVRFSGTNELTKGVGFYGILAVDNSEVKFVKVDQDKSGFYPTRCFVAVEGMANAKLIANHGEATGIKSVNNTTNNDSKIYNLNGVRQQRMQKGVNIIDGKKIIGK